MYRLFAIIIIATALLWPIQQVEPVIDPTSPKVCVLIQKENMPRFCFVR